LLTGKYFELVQELKKFIPEKNLIQDDLRLLAYGTDASFYRLVPKLVIRANFENEIQHILKICSTKNISVTFRAAGTSLSGQAVSDSVLILIDQGWKKSRILQNGEKISLQPGVIGRFANKLLAPLGKKIGPDPASINAAMIGGIAANNASGMCCGTAQNSYKTLSSMRIIFFDGTLLDTGDDSSIRFFQAKFSDFLKSVTALKDSVQQNKILSDKISQKFKMKNTTGYSLNALVDFDEPIEIIQHLMIGSEGTLGFISEITYNTVPDYPNKATSLMVFVNIETACKAVVILKKCPVEAVELMDRASLRSVEQKQGMPTFLKELDNTSAALLVETRSDSPAGLEENISFIAKALEKLSTLFPVHFTQDVGEFTRLWNIRKGLFPSVGAMRETGTTVIIEDVAFPVNRLAEATLQLQELFVKYNYSDAIIFGHALDGNLHFVFKQDFSKQEEIKRYQNFVNDVTKMVVEKYNGSLKAEHGTGRNMAPFVEMEWGHEAYELLKEIKNIFDPNNILNPGVVINNDPFIHIKNLKPLAPANPIIDKCIECGFCEPHCVSNTLTLSARQRIVAFREISRLKVSGETPFRLAQLLDDYEYLGNQTCATDGLCAMGCPVDIDTGKLIKELRFDSHSRLSNWTARRLANNMALVTAMARFGLNLVHAMHNILGDKTFGGITKFFFKTSAHKIPLWNPAMPRGARKIKIENVNERKNRVVYFPSCITRSMGISKDYAEKMDVMRKTISVLQKAGYEIIYPDNLNSLCCGMAFSSKGFKQQGDQKAQELEQALLMATNNGELSVLFDMSPCLYRMKETLDSKLRLYGPIEFTLEFLRDRLKFQQLSKTIAIHTVCSAKKMGLEEKFLQLAKMCADKVIVPENNCCGFAGDRGFSFPELNAHGLDNLKTQLPQKCEYGYSTSRTCEIGLTNNSGMSYKSILYLVDEATVGVE
jgi:D-lactate dehydrogenase